ncbi:MULTISPECIES: RNA polymerase factor sigma-54 [unclassified Devosia]|jgi:RNA polymerase sigma-54 factor|uniref:RNA polymerase factor sigma-54 n=1 Tax=unclassified Devosia TaxID=196773 RepID=UPI00086EEA7A|nr:MULTISPECIES: RNA polymerase factor sigma-54 [unclassified Devosia]MBN9362662.1 RNA polymerase factor sigma-54 [Devosia sp.]ODS83867.1 MAG: RNA polymerase sigma-54 factor [Devosia sp. SCN 66-27]OJX23848.1 MAG: RNA polymerase sigma-54 factor [Devosia sp. 66-14]
MALSPRLEVRQSQGLTLTPQLMQSIRLLQLSHLELNSFVEAELLRNPLLEREDGAEPADEPTEAPERPAELNAAEDTVDYSERIQSADSIANGYDTEVENVFPDQSAPERQTDSTQWNERSGGGDGEAADIDQFVAARPTLADHLAAQAGLIINDPGERLIAQFLIDSVNEAGYLAVELETVAEQLGAPVGTIEAVLGKLQGCDPVGVFARDVRECLALQLRENDRLDPLMLRLLDNLELIAQHDLNALARVVGADREDLLDMLAELRQLDPRPGRAFEAGPVESVVPDVFVRPGPGGEWQIELNADVLPRVLVNRTYYASVTKKTRDTAEKSFLTDCLATANWLAKSLDQRAQTILKVTAEIVKQQDGFLVHGITHLKPMTLKAVADAIEMHESTVSRVTSNKYVSTPRGLFEMKYFFTTALGSSTGEGDHSAEAVRHRIRQIIDAEQPSDILSDDTIAEMLQKERGIEVARRTVAKYREGMNIPSSVIRRRQKRAVAAAAR